MPTRQENRVVHHGAWPRRAMGGGAGRELKAGERVRLRTPARHPRQQGISSGEAGRDHPDGAAEPLYSTGAAPAGAPAARLNGKQPFFRRVSPRERRLPARQAAGRVSGSSGRSGPT
jgi:hypothetical protein